jgi:hypothetical protein
MATVNKKKASKKKASKKTGTTQGDPTIGAILGSMEMAHCRAIAMNSGDLSVFVVQELMRVMDEQNNDRAKVIQVGIERLVADGYVSSQEAKDLKTITKLVLDSVNDKVDVAEACLQAKTLYMDMVMSGQSSSVALAITSAASASLFVQAASTLLPEDAIPADMEFMPEDAGVNAIVGGVLGAMVGGLIGGATGAGFGASLGATSGGAISYFNEKSG